jgi:glycosyltransferase involved in cell wall biosynthesis
VSDKVRIMHVRDSSGIFGAERVILSIANNIDRRRFDLKLLCMQRADGKSSKLMRRASEIGIEVIPVAVDRRFDPFAILKMKRVFSENGVQIVHTHDFKSDFYALVAGAGTGIRRVSTAHGSTRDSRLKRFYLYWDERVLYRAFDRGVVVSKDLEKHLLGMKVPTRKIRVIQNGLDFGLLKGETEERERGNPLQMPPEKAAFAVIGRLYPDKGHRFFLEAIAAVSKSKRGVVGLIVGDGPARDDIAEQVVRLKLDEHVRLCGFRSDMQAVYDRISCLVIPSLTEGLPYVLLEAMAGKVPVIATAVGDIPALIQDRRSGFLVPPGDASSIAERMIEILDDPNGAREMAEYAYRNVVERFSAERMVRETERLYLEVMNEPSEGARCR